MAATKETLAASGAVSDQQALVQLMLGKVVNKPLKHIIPGGKHMFKAGNEMNLAQLEQAIYTWLRRVRTFEECSITFTDKPETYPAKTVRVIDFPTDANAPIWHIPAKGKTYLAKVMAQQIAKGNLVSVLAKKDGLYVIEEPTGKLNPNSQDWAPYLEFVRSKKSEYSVY